MYCALSKQKHVATPTAATTGSPCPGTMGGSGLASMGHKQLNTQRLHFNKFSA